MRRLSKAIGLQTPELRHGYSLELFGVVKMPSQGVVADFFFGYRASKAKKAFRRSFRAFLNLSCCGA